MTAVAVDAALHCAGPVEEEEYAFRRRAPQTAPEQPQLVLRTRRVQRCLFCDGLLFAEIFDADDPDGGPTDWWEAVEPGTPIRRTVDCPRRFL